MEKYNIDILMGDYPSADIETDGVYWYIDLNTGLGVGSYKCSEFTLQEAIHDQIHESFCYQ